MKTPYASMRRPAGRRGLLLALLTSALFASPVRANDATSADIDPATGLRRLPYMVNTQPARYEHTGPTLLRHVRVINGRGDAPKDDQDVLVENGRIAKIAKGGAIAPPPSARVIDGNDMTLLPGLMDLHIHFRGIDRFANMIVDDAAMLTDVYRYKAQLYGFLYSGVTTVLDVGTSPRIAVGLKRLIDQGYILGPRFFWSGPILEGGVDMSSFENQAIPSVDKVKPTIDYLQALQVDFVKLYQGTSDNIIRATTNAAHQAKLRVLIDAWERNDLAQFVEYGGVDGYAHLNFHFRISDHDAAVLAKHKSFVFTTFYALNVFSGRVYSERPGYFDDPLIADIMPPEYLARFKRNPLDPLAQGADAILHHVIEPFEDHMSVPQGGSRRVVFDSMSKIGGDNLRKLLDAGVLVAAGTDGGEGESTLVELELMVADARISPLKAIQLATYNAAKVLGQETTLGSVQEGMIADLLLVRGDPSKNIRDIRNIQAVLKDGKIIDRKSLTRQWAY